MPWNPMPLVAPLLLPLALTFAPPTPQDTSPQDTSPQDTSPQDASPQDSASQDSASPHNPADIVWRLDLKAAEEDARRHGKPMLVVFRCEA